MLRENNLCLLANLCVYKSKKYDNPRYIYKSSKYYYTQIFEIPKFLPNILQTLLVSISGTDISTKFLPVVHIFSLTIMTYLKMLIGIKSLSKSDRVIYDCCLSLCCKSKELYDLRYKSNKSQYITSF